MPSVCFALMIGVPMGALVGASMRHWLTRWNPRYLVVLSATGTALIWWRFGCTPAVVPLCVLVWWFSALTAVDLRCRRLPNALTIPGAMVVTVAIACTGSWGALVGGALLFAVYLSVHLVARGAFGAGDVKLAWSVGAIAGLGGAEGWVVAALSAPVATASVGLIAAAFGYRGARIAHGPSMCAATLLALTASLA